MEELTDDEKKFLICVDEWDSDEYDSGEDSDDDMDYEEEDFV